jgi:hypothetical protein
MPPQRTWLGRRKEILQILEKSTARELNRSLIERVFQVQKRTALLMMKEMEPVLRDAQWLVTKKKVLAWTRALADAADMEERRHQHTIEILDQTVEEDRAVRAALSGEGHAAQSFPLIDEILCSSLQHMPPGVHLAPGRITIHFPAPEPQHALEALYALAKALANDWESFVRLQTKSLARQWEVPSPLNIPSPPPLPELPW